MTARATSSVSASLPIGIDAAYRACASGDESIPFVMSVSIMPGETALTATPYAAASLANETVNDTTAPLEAA